MKDILILRFIKIRRSEKLFKTPHNIDVDLHLKLH
jgi:hypothetical protein